MAITQAKPEADLALEERRTLPKPSRAQRALEKLNFSNVPQWDSCTQCLPGFTVKDFERVF